MYNYYRGLCFSQDSIDKHGNIKNCYNNIIDNIVKEHAEIFKNWLIPFSSLNRFLPERVFTLHFPISQRFPYVLRTNAKLLRSFIEHYEDLLMDNNINDMSMINLLNKFSYIVGLLSKEDMKSHLYIVEQLDDLIRPIEFPIKEK